MAFALRQRINTNDDYRVHLVQVVLFVTRAECPWEMPEIANALHADGEEGMRWLVHKAGRACMPVFKLQVFELWFPIKIFLLLLTSDQILFLRITKHSKRYKDYTLLLAFREPDTWSTNRNYLQVSQEPTGPHTHQEVSLCSVDLGMSLLFYSFT